MPIRSRLDKLAATVATIETAATVVSVDAVLNAARTGELSPEQVARGREAAARYRVHRTMPADASRMDEILACEADPYVFIDRHAFVYDAAGDWIRFRLWKEQLEVLDAITNHQLTIVLKARQLGMSWLAICYGLWLMIFRPAATVLVFSRRQDEAAYLLSDERARGVYNRLPEWLRSEEMAPDSTMTWALRNGSVARGFPTTGGDSYTASLAIVDEADLAPDLNKLMRSVKPTIDGGGQMILLSRSDKSKPESEFKRIYRAAKAKLTPWHPIFLPWYVRPERTQEWYEAQRTDILQRTGSLDDLCEQYPATDTEALSPRVLDKRLAAPWLQQCYEERSPLSDVAGSPAIPGLEVFVPPSPRGKYVIGADPAEGNPNSDDSALAVLDIATGEEVASLAGKYDPSIFAAHIAAIATYYNSARVLVERNNHGHAVILWLRDHTQTQLLTGDDGREGWHTSSKSKAIMWATCADAFRDRQTILHSFLTFVQLASIEGSTGRAPDGEHDDRAIAHALALQARARDCGAMEFRQIKLRADGPPEVAAPTNLRWPQHMRWFAPTKRWQGWCEKDGTRLWLPEFDSEDQAAYSVELAHQWTGQGPLSLAPEPELYRDEVEDVERRTREHLRGLGFRCE